MNPAHSLSNRVVFPVPVVPITTWWERSRAYGRAAMARAGCRTARIVPPTTTSPLRRVSGTAPGAAIRARALRTCRRHCRRSNPIADAGDSPPAPVSIR